MTESPIAFLSVIGMVLFCGMKYGFTHSITFEFSFSTPGEVMFESPKLHRNRTSLLLPQEITLYAMEIVVSMHHRHWVCITFIPNLIGSNAHFSGEETEKNGRVVQIVLILSARVGNVFHCVLQCFQMLCGEIISWKDGIPTSLRPLSISYHGAAFVLRTGLRSVRLNIE